MADWLDRPSPADVEAERALLGGLLQDPWRLVDLGRELKPDDFYRPEHGALFRLLLVMQATGKDIDLVTVAAELVKGEGADRYGGAGYVAELPEHCPSTENLRTYVASILATSQRRAVLKQLLVGVERVYDGHQDPAMLAQETSTALLEATAGGPSRDLLDAVELHAEWVDTRTKVEEGRAREVRVPTGLTGLDAMLTGGGLLGGQLVVVGGRPGMGKTALALAICDHVAEQGWPVLYVSAEQPRQQMLARLLARRMWCTTDELDPEDERLYNEAAEVRGLHIPDPSAPSTEWVDQQIARVIARTGNLGLVAIDYLQRMHHDKSRGETADTYIGRTVTESGILARKHGVPVLLLAQMNREIERRPKPRKGAATGAWWETERIVLPIKSDLRDTGKLEADADVILFPLNGPGCEVSGGDKLGCVVVGKQRNGPIGVAPVVWDGPSATYRS